MSSRFRDVLKNRTALEADSPIEEPPPAPNVETPPPLPSPAPKTDRPKGKKVDGLHVQTTAYVRKETYRAVQRELLEDDPKQDYSELVQSLLVGWLESRRQPSRMPDER